MVDNSRYYVGDRMMYGKFAYLKGKYIAIGTKTKK